ncbi:hypothetical protein QJS04_geneDACA024206 [Acorus gramineus]|uniref:Uncharacterized protein n=1 Tax=Acorus gramineus TaxID=55184 RepID=A0AAV8ZW73_ACOGR|nr:hypothetical protein QJS04_geneDACA024206 [Acorus gramineus]
MHKAIVRWCNPFPTTMGRPPTLRSPRAACTLHPDPLRMIAPDLPMMTPCRPTILVVPGSLYPSRHRQR